MTAPAEAMAPPAQGRRGWNRARIAGHAAVLAWSGLGLALAWLIVSGFEAEFFWRYFPRLMQGLWVTIELVAISVGLGLVLAFPIAFARLSRNRLIGALAFGYVYVFRGTPIIAQVFLVYYGSGQFREWFEDWGLWWFFREAFYCAALTFTLNSAAYQAEILRGAIEAVPRGQREAAQSLGLPRAVLFWKIVLPQAMIIALRPLGNEIILMIKASAIASVVTIFDLMGATRLAFARSFNFDVYLWAAIIYLLMVEILRRVWDALERRLTRHLRPYSG